MDRTTFANPGADARGVTLWMLNDLLEPAELRRQLAEIRNAGIGAVITRTYNGLRTPYLSEAWMTCLRTVVETARELGIPVYFQAGYMPGGIPDWPAEHAMVVAKAVPVSAPAGEEQILVADAEYRYVAWRQPHMLDMLNPASVRAYLRQSYEEPWLTRFGEEFGKTITSIWVDEPHFPEGVIPWSPYLLQQFSAQWGYDLTSHLPALFRECPDAPRVRHHFWRTVTRLLRDAYFEEIHQWCAAHGLQFSGHLMAEDTLTCQIAATGACMPLYEKMHIPGIDHLTASRSWPRWHPAREFPSLLTPLQCASAAHQFGHRHILAEMYGVSSSGLTFADRKHIAEFLFVLGINTRCLHASFYSLRGLRKRVYPPSLSYQQPYWPQNRVIADYCARVSYALQQGEYLADVLVLHPIESAYSLHPATTGHTVDGCPWHEETHGITEHLFTLAHHLLQVHRGFDFGDESIMAAHGDLQDGQLRVGRMAYRVVVLPDLITVRRSTVELLTRFLDAGGAVLATGRLPTRIEGEDDAAIALLTARIIRVEPTPKALTTALEAVCPAVVHLDAVAGPIEQLWLHQRRVEDRRLLYLVNSNTEEAIEADIRLTGRHGLESWDAASGTVMSLPVTHTGGSMQYRLALPPGGSALLLTTSPSAVDAPRPHPQQLACYPLPACWSVHRLAPNALTLDHCRLRKGNGPFSDVLPVIAVKQILQEDDPYEGPITLRFAFQTQDLPARLHLVVEDPDAGSIQVNDMPVSTSRTDYFRDRAFRTIDITALARLGENTITIAGEFHPTPHVALDLLRLFCTTQGTEVESIYLIGDFAVRGTVSPRPSRPESVRYQPTFTLAAEGSTTDGDMIADGYPFFTGTMALQTTVTLEPPPRGHRAFLRLPFLEACVTHVVVNGRDAGIIAWQPHQVEITDLLQAGENTITLTITNTLRNLLGSHHRPHIEGEHAWGDAAFSGRYCRETYTQYPHWYRQPIQETDAWTNDYYFVRFGLYGAAEIVILAN